MWSEDLVRADGQIEGLSRVVVAKDAVLTIVCRDPRRDAEYAGEPEGPAVDVWLGEMLLEARDLGLRASRDAFAAAGPRRRRRHHGRLGCGRGELTLGGASLARLMVDVAFRPRSGDSARPD